MPRTKGAKDKAVRSKPKVSSKSDAIIAAEKKAQEVNLGSRRQIISKSSMGTNDGEADDFTNEANKAILENKTTTSNNTDTMATTPPDDKSNEVNASSAAADNKSEPTIVIQPAEKKKIDAEDLDLTDDDLPENNPASEYSPLTEESVIERDYAINPINEGAPPIDEPVIVPPSFEDEPAPPGTIDTPPTPPLTNPALAEKSHEEKMRGAEMFVDGGLEVYSEAWKYAGKYVEVPDEQVMQMAAEGKIDPKLKLDLGTQEITAAELIASFNRQSKDVLSVSDSFIKDVRPPLVRVFYNKGWGASDEQYLMFKFGKDLAIKTSAVVSMKKNMNNILRVLQERKKESDENVIRIYENEAKVAELGEELNQSASTIQELKEAIERQVKESKQREAELQAAIKAAAKSEKDGDGKSGVSGSKSATGKSKSSSVKISQKDEMSFKEPEEQRKRK